MPPWLQSIITIVGAVLASSGFWTFLQRKADRKDVKSEMLKGLAHDRIISLGMTYLARGYILQSEYEDLYDYLYVPYSKLGGNGTGKHMMDSIAALPMFSTHILAKEALGHEAVEHNV